MGETDCGWGKLRGVTVWVKRDEATDGAGSVRAVTVGERDGIISLGGIDGITSLGGIYEKEEMVQAGKPHPHQFRWSYSGAMENTHTHTHTQCPEGPPSW